MAKYKMHYDCSKAIRELGIPQTPPEVALEKAVRWFRDQSMHNVQMSERSVVNSESRRSRRSGTSDTDRHSITQDSMKIFDLFFKTILFRPYVFVFLAAFLFCRNPIDRLAADLAVLAD